MIGLFDYLYAEECKSYNPMKCSLEDIQSWDDSLLKRRIDNLEFLLMKWQGARHILERGVIQGQASLDQHDASVRDAESDLETLQNVLTIRLASRTLRSLGVQVSDKAQAEGGSQDASEGAQQDTPQ